MSATFYGESEFNEKVIFHDDININARINGVSITASNAYGTRYVSVGSTPSSNSTGSNGDVWYTI